VDFDVISINLYIDISGLKSRDNAAISKSLSGESKTGLNLDSVKVNFSISTCNNKRSNLVSERTRSKLSGKIVAGKNKGVFGSVSG